MGIYLHIYRFGLFILVLKHNYLQMKTNKKTKKKTKRKMQNWDWDLSQR